MERQEFFSLLEFLYGSGEGTHKHRCEGCGTTWEHANNLSQVLDEDGYGMAHLCPVCGHDVRKKYYGDAKPQFVQDCSSGEVRMTAVTKNT